MRFPDALIQIFCKAPVPGTVKTRLAATIGDEAACRVHAQLATRMIETAIQSATAPVQIWCTPDAQDPFFDQFDAARRVQEGHDLGERMRNALELGLEEGARRVVLVGTDCPPIDDDYLAAAFDALEHHDAVLGPAEDGGYGLIGLARPCAEAFEGIDWGTGSVARETLRRIEQCGRTVQVLKEIWDVDEAGDLERWRATTGGQPG